MTGEPCRRPRRRRLSRLGNVFTFHRDAPFPPQPPGSIRLHVPQRGKLERTEMWDCIIIQTSGECKGFFGHSLGTPFFRSAAHRATSCWSFRPRSMRPRGPMGRHQRLRTCVGPQCEPPGSEGLRGNALRAWSGIPRGGVAPRLSRGTGRQPVIVLELNSSLPVSAFLRTRSEQVAPPP